MNNALMILNLLDSKLTAPVELVLYGRAALFLGFEHPPQEFALSQDIDVILWRGQAEELMERTNFWQAVEEVNTELEDQGLFITHFFTEDQIILRPCWLEKRVPIPGSWQNLCVYRPSAIDLVLSKLMRYDPIDLNDAVFIISQATLKKTDIMAALEEARIPDIPEIQEQFALASQKLLTLIDDNL